MSGILLFADLWKFLVKICLPRRFSCSKGLVAANSYFYIWLHQSQVGWILNGSSVAGTFTSGYINLMLAGF
jgi:hypothetical protein